MFTCLVCLRKQTEDCRVAISGYQCSTDRNLVFITKFSEKRKEGRVAAYWLCKEQNRIQLAACGLSVQFSLEPFWARRAKFDECNPGALSQRVYGIQLARHIRVPFEIRHKDLFRVRHQLEQNLQSLACDLRAGETHTGDIPAWLANAINQIDTLYIGEGKIKDHWDIRALRGCLHFHGCLGREDKDQVHLISHKFFGNASICLYIYRRGLHIVDNILALHVS